MTEYSTILPASSKIFNFYQNYSDANISLKSFGRRFFENIDINYIDGQKWKMRISFAVFQNFRSYFIFSVGNESTLYLEIFTEYSSNREEKSWKFLRNYVD